MVNLEVNRSLDKSNSHKYSSKCLFLQKHKVFKLVDCCHPRNIEACVGRMQMRTIKEAEHLRQIQSQNLLLI